RMLQSLALDFYRPLQLAELHERLYPREYFNPFSSPDRVHQAARRLRRWLQENRIPLGISEELGQYRLSSDRGCTVVVQAVSEKTWLETAPGDIKLRALLGVLKNQHGNEVFSAVEAGKLL